MLGAVQYRAFDRPAGGSAPIEWALTDGGAMTLGVAWIRSTGGVREMVFASDSRLSGGSPERWDACPKILTLPRSDALISFAGVTELAYPAMLQVARAIEVHPGLVNRLFDITTLSSLVEDVLNQMVKLVKTGSRDSLLDSLRQTEFLLGGFSWQLGRFKLWRFAWKNSESRYVKRRCLPTRQLGADRVCKFIGGPSGPAREKLRELLESRPRGEIGMEPVEVLQLFIDAPEYDDVGGAPQIVKTYRHLNSEPFSVLWPPNGDGQATFAGRPLLRYEKSFTPPLDLRKPDAHSARLQADEAAIIIEGLPVDSTT
ncbi:hypothetical protein SAMN05880568_2031 [Microbacterium sp. RURRCA19A]|nr:hypothetical protein SAMN05880568_2031 [Microbacterium sp. RURRCA19A]